MSEYHPHYRVVLDLGPLESQEAARLKAAAVEKCANAGAGPALVVDIMAAEFTWSSVTGCEVCGSLVCAGRQAHRAEIDNVGVDAGYVNPLPDSVVNPLPADLAGASQSAGAAPGMQFYPFSAIRRPAQGLVPPDEVNGK